MEKNGKLFISTISATEFVSSVWDPYVYRKNGEVHSLSHYATVQRVGFRNTSSVAPFEPIEYKHIPHGNYLGFTLEPRISQLSSMSVTPENSLLFGTMRAYLANILITPMAEWIGQKSPLFFHVKSEFVSVSPLDELPYFWMIYLRSRQFLENLPVGGGGTRPRLQAKSLSDTPVKVPDVKIRKEIHDRLKELAQKEWLTYFETTSIINNSSAY
jgi:hypothetical protein